MNTLLQNLTMANIYLIYLIKLEGSIMRSFLKLAGLFLLLACTSLSFAETNVSGAITTNTVWNLAGSPYNVTNDVTVTGGGSLATLTIEPGVQVRFYPSTSMIIGSANSATPDGQLIAVGNTDAPITFTTYYDGTKAVNTWRSIFFNNSADDNSVLDNCVLEYGITAITATNANPAVENSTIRNFSDYALHVYEDASPVMDANTIENCKSAMVVSNKGTGSPVFSNNTVDNCSEFGVKVNGPDATPQINNNAFTNVTEYIIFVYPDQVGGLWGNTEANNNPKKNMVYVSGGEVTKDAVWQETDITLLLSNNVFVKGASGVMVTLNLASGLDIKVEEHKGLYIGSANEQEPAKLMASGVSFSSVRDNVDASIPSGFWYAIHFDASADDASVVDNCTIMQSEYGTLVSGSAPTFSNNMVSDILYNGVFIKDTASPTVSGNTFDAMPTAIVINSAATGTPVISSNTIENCSAIAIKVEGANAMPTISNNVFNGNATFLVDLYPNQANMLSGSTGSDNTADFNFLRIKAANYTASGTWSETEIGYFISGNVFVKGAANPALEITEGATLNFTSNAGLYVGAPVGGDPGKLVANGVTFTSRKTTAAAGDWNAVVFDSTADASSIVNNSTIEYSITGINVLGSSPTISNNTFQNILNNGIFISKNSAPTISGNTFTAMPVGVHLTASSTATPTISGNTFDALAANANPVAIQAGSGNDMTFESMVGVPIITDGDKSAPVITGNTFSNLTNYVADLAPNQVGKMSGSVAADNDPQFNHINVRPGNMTMNSNWNETEVGYFLSGDVTVAGVGAEAALNIGSGVGVYFFRNTGLWIGSATATNTGKLVATGAKFTTFDLADPDPGEWESIYFYDNASNSCSLSGCTLEYAKNALEINGADVAVTNSTIENLQLTAVLVNGSSNVTLNDNTFDTMNQAVLYNTTAVGDLVIHGNSFSNIVDNVIVIKNNAVEPMITGNSFTDNNNYLVQLFPDDAKNFSGNTYENNRLNEIFIQRGYITEDAVWAELGVAYYIFDDVFVEGANGMATLDIKPGVKVYFNSNADLIIGSNLNGALLAQGKEKANAGDDTATGKLLAKGVTFTSGNTVNPVIGTWTGITFDELASDSSKISRSTIEYAINGVRLNYTHAFIEINTFQNNSENNIYCYGGSPTVMYNDLLGAKRGVYAVLEGNPVINYNNIEGSANYGVQNTSAVITINAENNWWGRTSGPAGVGPGSGTQVSDMVDYDPFLTEAFVPVFPPMEFSLLSPATGAVFNAGDITFDWEDAIDDDPGDVVTYTLYISTSATFEAAATTEITDLTDSQYLWNSNLILNTPVYWKVKANDTNTEGTWSTETFTLTIQVLPPAEFSLLTPVDDDSTEDTDVTFTWETTTNSALGGALTYTFYLSTDAEFTAPEMVEGLTQATYTKMGLTVNTQYFWKVKAVDENSDGRESTETFKIFIKNPTAVEEESQAIPTEFSLSQNYPNPFNPTTSIRYGLPVASEVKVTLHNALGQEIVTLVDGVQSAGYHTAVWNASNFGSGVYFIRIQAGDFSSIKKAVLTK